MFTRYQGYLPESCRWMTVVAMIFLLAGCLGTRQTETGFLDRSVTMNGNEYRYQVYVPRDYDSTRAWPVILFLHGGGERGTEGLKPTHVGLGEAIRFNPQRWPAIAVFPQVPEEENWQGMAGAVAMAALDNTIDEFSIDQSRQYLTGLSLGGNGTWYLGYHHADRFAALVAICSFISLRTIESFLPGTSDPYGTLAQALADKPVWLVHGDADTVVSVEESRRMNAALRAVGAEVHYTELPGVNHNSWDAAYGNEEIIDWLFMQRN